MEEITSDTPVEALVVRHPEAVGFLIRRGIRCIRCGEPLWCTLGELFRESQVPCPRELLAELNDFLAKT